VSLPRAVLGGTLVGAVAALGFYTAIGPDDLGRAAVPAPPTFAPVPTPTVTQLVVCVPPAKLTKGVCVTVKPGPTITARPTGGAAPTSAPRPAPPQRTTDAQEPEHGDDDGDEHDGDDHDGDDEHDD